MTSNLTQFDLKRDIKTKFIGKALYSLENNNCLSIFILLLILFDCA